MFTKFVKAFMIILGSPLIILITGVQVLIEIYKMEVIGEIENANC